MRKFISYALLCISLFACRKDEPPEPTKTPVQVGFRPVLITNEGNFQFGNASVSLYKPEDKSVVEDIYRSTNEEDLGDVCQSMTLFNGRAYLVMNNSQKVIVASAADLEKQNEITGLTSPRYLLPVSNSKAYVTDLYANAVSIVDLSSNQLTGSIPVRDATEELTLAYGRAYVCCGPKSMVYVINTATDRLEDSITVGYGANSIVEDSEGKLWVLCAGKEDLAGSLFRIDPVSSEVVLSMEFSTVDALPWRLDINPGKDTLYFLAKGLFRMATSSATLPSEPFVSENSRNFYGLGIDPRTGDIYVSDAIDYVQRGSIFVFRPSGAEVTNFKAGIIPGDFYFP